MILLVSHMVGSPLLPALDGQPDGRQGKDDEDGVVPDRLVDPQPRVRRPDQPDEDEDGEHGQELEGDIHRVDPGPEHRA